MQEFFISLHRSDTINVNTYEKVYGDFQTPAPPHFHAGSAGLKNRSGAGFKYLCFVPFIASFSRVSLLKVLL